MRARCGPCGALVGLPLAPLRCLVWGLFYWGSPGVLGHQSQAYVETLHHCPKVKPFAGKNERQQYIVSLEWLWIVIMHAKSLGAWLGNLLSGTATNACFGETAGLKAAGC